MPRTGGARVACLERGVCGATPPKGAKESRRSCRDDLRECLAGEVSALPALRRAASRLVELIVTMAIMLTVFTAITDTFASGVNAETERRWRTQAQLDARQALALMREDLNCAYAVQAVGPRRPGLGFRLLPLPDRAVQHVPDGRLSSTSRAAPRSFSPGARSPSPASRASTPSTVRTCSGAARRPRPATRRGRSRRPTSSLRRRRVADECRRGDAVDLERQHLARLARSPARPTQTNYLPTVGVDMAVNPAIPSRSERDVRAEGPAHAAERNAVRTCRHRRRTGTHVRRLGADARLADRRLALHGDAHRPARRRRNRHDLHAEPRRSRSAGLQLAVRQRSRLPANCDVHRAASAPRPSPSTTPPPRLSAQPTARRSGARRSRSVRALPRNWSGA